MSSQKMKNTNHQNPIKRQTHLSDCNFLKSDPSVPRKIAKISESECDHDEKLSKAEENLDQTIDGLGTQKCCPQPCKWRVIQAESLELRYSKLYGSKAASALMRQCESELVYNTGHLAKVKMFGKLLDIPRKQVAHGDAGLTYTFAGNTIPALPWTPLLTEIRRHISEASGYDFNFVLINRYKDGQDYMGEHKDDEKDLCKGYPIASLSLGQARDFVFRHQDCRGGFSKRNQAGKNSSDSLSVARQRKSAPSRPLIEPVTVLLEHGSLLLMEGPTNQFWYHSLPKRARAVGVRINMTFRRMEPSHCKPCRHPEAAGT